MKRSEFRFDPSPDLKLLKRKNFLNSLPSELIQLILSFYAKDVQRLLFFRTICKRWKDEADYSPLWLIIPLSFYCSHDYFRIRSNSSFSSTRLWMGNQKPLIVHLNNPVTKYPANHYKIVFDPDILLNKQELYSRPSEQITKVREKFMQLYLKYHHLWHWYCVWMPRIQSLMAKSSELVANFYSGFYGVKGLICVIIANTLLTDLSNNSSNSSVIDHTCKTSIQWNHYIGFAFLFFFLLSQYILFIAFGINLLFCALIFFLSGDLNSQFEFGKFIPFLTLISLMTGSLFFLGVVFLHSVESNITSLLLYFLPSLISTFPAIGLGLGIDFLILKDGIQCFIPFSIVSSAILFIDMILMYVLMLISENVLSFPPIFHSFGFSFLKFLFLFLSIADNFILCYRYYFNQEVRSYIGYRDVGPINKFYVQLISDVSRTIALIITYYGRIQFPDCSFSSGTDILTILILGSPFLLRLVTRSTSSLPTPAT